MPWLVFHTYTKCQCCGNDVTVERSSSRGFIELYIPPLQRRTTAYEVLMIFIVYVKSDDNQRTKSTEFFNAGIDCLFVLFHHFRAFVTHMEMSKNTHLSFLNGYTFHIKKKYVFVLVSSFSNVCFIHSQIFAIRCFQIILHC